MRVASPASGWEFRQSVGGSLPWEWKGEPFVTAPTAAKKSLTDYVRNSAGILRKYGETDAAALIESKFFATESTASVVVVGEVKRGKSSLVNALIGRPGLLPSDVDESTSMPIQVLPVDAAATERIDLHFGDHAESHDLSELITWSTTAGTQVKAPDVEELPSHATVHIGRGVELRAVIVDTPGAGGLDDAAVDLALSAARGAGVLVMVCDATTPITAPEIDILVRAAETVGSVIVVVSKIDKALTRWRSIVEENKRLIREYASMEVPVLGVSSLRALSALTLDDVGRREKLETTSGIAALRTLISKRASGADALSRAVALNVAVASMKRISATVDEQIRATDQPSQVVEELETRKEELKGLRDHGQEWEQFLSRNVSVARQRVLGEFDQALESIREKWTQEINRSGLVVLRRKPQVFTAQIEADVNKAIQQLIHSMSAALKTECDHLFDDPNVWLSIADEAIRALAGPQHYSSREVGKKTDNLIDPSVISVGVLGGTGLATLGSSALATVGLSMVAFPAVAVGGGWIAINLAYRAMRNGKQHLHTWVRESCTSARVAAGREIDTLINLSRTEMVVRYRARLRWEQDNIQQRLQAAQSAVRADESSRKAQVERLRKNSKIINSHIDYLESVIAGLPVEQRNAL